MFPSQVESNSPFNTGGIIYQWAMGSIVRISPGQSEKLTQVLDIFSMAR